MDNYKKCSFILYSLLETWKQFCWRNFPLSLKREMKSWRTGFSFLTKVSVCSSCTPFNALQAAFPWFGSLPQKDFFWWTFILKYLLLLKTPFKHNKSNCEHFVPSSRNFASPRASSDCRNSMGSAQEKGNSVSLKYYLVLIDCSQ